MTLVKKIREKFKNALTFTTRDVCLFLGKATNKKYVELLMYNFVKKGEVHRITKGTYTFREEMQLVGQAFQPSYYGLQDALSLHGLWEQETNPVIITPRKVRPGIREFLGNNYLVKRINRRMFFGFELLKYADFWINTSDVEKTLIDMAYFKQYLDQKTLEEIRKKIDQKKMADYLKKCPKHVKKKVEKMMK